MQRSFNQWLTISNVLSALRLAMAPAIVVLVRRGLWPQAAIAFAIGCLTDALDGYIARLLKQQTKVGQFLDPVADKVFILSVLSVLTSARGLLLPLPSWFLAIVVVRELVLISGGIYLLWQGKAGQATPSLLGKLSTVGYMALIAWYFMCYVASWVPVKTFTVALWIVSGIALASLVHYCLRTIRMILRP